MGTPSLGRSVRWFAVSAPGHVVVVDAAVDVGVDVDPEVAPALDALPSFAHVCGPTTPSTPSPFLLW